MSRHSEAPRESIGDLIREKEGLINRRVFVDEDIYELELERIFARCWLFLGHTSQLRRRHDFFRAYMGEDEVVVTKNARGEVNAFLNSCSHRGMQVVREDAGNSRAFICSYHGWTYGSDGALVAATNHDDGYHGQLDLSCRGLPKVAKVDTFRGLVFATMDRDAPTLREFLGDIAWYLDILFDTNEDGIELIGPAQRWPVKTNWKMPADNFIGDFQHAQSVSHVSALRTLLGGALPMLPATGGVQMRTAGGHGLFIRQITPEQADVDKPNLSAEVNEYFRAARIRTTERLGELRGSGVLDPVAGTVFPNLSFLCTPTFPSLRVWQPRGPGEIEISSWCFVPADAPDEVKDTVRRTYQATFGPGGIFEEDDVEHWQLSTQANRGRVTRRGWLSYEMGLGHDFVDPNLPGSASLLISEANARGFYTRWRELMTDETWAKRQPKIGPTGGSS